MNRASILLISILVHHAAYSQAPGIEWQKALGGSADEYGEAVEQTSDGGYVVVGSTNSNNGDVIGQHGGFDMWVVKLDADGAVTWKKALGGSLDDYGLAIKQTSDLGFIAAGISRSSDGDVTANQGGPDFWVVKLDPTGAIEWQKTYGGTGQDNAYDILQTADGGYVVAGETTSNDGDVSGNHGLFDMWVLRLDAAGALIWQRALGSAAGGEYAYAVVDAGDGGYVVAGSAGANGGDVTGYHGGNYDYWIVKLDSDGQLEWQKACGGTGLDIANTMVRNNDGSYAVVGFSGSDDGDITGQHGQYDCWVVRIDAGGSLVWQIALGGSETDAGGGILETSSGDLIVTGSTESTDGDVSVNLGNDDVWLLRLNDSGTLLWEKTFGGSDVDGSTDIVSTGDGGYTFIGSTRSNDGDVTSNQGGLEMWAVKLWPDHTNVTETTTIPLVSVYPNPTAGDLFLAVGLDVIGDVRIALHDAVGNLLDNKESVPMAAGARLHVPTKDLLPGVYHLSVITTSGMITRAFVKQ